MIQPKGKSPKKMEAQVPADPERYILVGQDSNSDETPLMHLFGPASLPEVEQAAEEVAKDTELDTAYILPVVKVVDLEDLRAEDEEEEEEEPTP